MLVNCNPCFFSIGATAQAESEAEAEAGARARAIATARAITRPRARAKARERERARAIPEEPTGTGMTEARGHKVHHYTLAVATFIIDFNVRHPEILIALFNFCKKSVNPQNVLRWYLAEMVTKFCPPLGLSQ